MGENIRLELHPPPEVYLLPIRHVARNKAYEFEPPIFFPLVTPRPQNVFTAKSLTNIIVLKDFINLLLCIL